MVDYKNHPNQGKRVFGRGDLKVVLLLLLNEQPRHGYDLIKGLKEKFNGFYSPSPGSIYPLLQLLEDQRHVTHTKEGRKKVFSITKEGQTYLEEHQDSDPIMTRLNMFKTSNVEEITIIRDEIQSVSEELFKVGRQSMMDEEKKAAFLQLLKDTKQQLAQLSDGKEKKSN
ncbi:PadR family transcriptional regulator [Alkalicoccobacillus porphyridii]|uniref:Helix-turn-helix transcriptional regulator n=1 Tax=Alkalicoccobacillus porphyridii TaxID=2597270 RepID=A0A554A284_9BACI|nr:PadR family transcriptional regulator [Alkalicoccobacillus porphyridii]TSB47793.1 helix-turn-helix transcriptional regulator [Alkalicoccobacillus porphyridii]